MPPNLNSPKNDSSGLLEPIQKPAVLATGDIERVNDGELEPTNSE